MSEPTCNYHPERTAVEKCERCGKLICLECKMVYHETRSIGRRPSSGLQSSFGSSTRRSYYDTRYEVCPVCFYELQEEGVAKSKAPMYMGVGFLGFFVLIIVLFFIPFYSIVNEVPSSRGSAFSTMFIVIPIIMLLIPGSILFFIIYKMVVTDPKTSNEAKAKKEEFLRSVGQRSGFTGSSRLSSSKKHKASGFCSYCGDELVPGDQYCPSCGKERA